jgi:hypothetical protein
MADQPTNISHRSCVTSPVIATLIRRRAEQLSKGEGPATWQGCLFQAVGDVETTLAAIRELPAGDQVLTRLQLRRPKRRPRPPPVSRMRHNEVVRIRRRLAAERKKVA